MNVCRKEKIIDLLAEFRIRVSRGVGIIYDFRQAMVIGAAAQIILRLSVLQAIIVTFLAYIGFLVIGSLKIIVDLSKRQAELNTSKYNPHLNKISKIIEKFK